MIRKDTHNRVTEMNTYQFLSPKWVSAVRDIREEMNALAHNPTTEFGLRANVTIVDAPFTNANVLGHLNTTSGTVVLEEGHINNADFSLEMPYLVAYQIFIERDPSAFMGILLSGSVKMSGDVSQFLLLADFIAPVFQDAQENRDGSNGHSTNTAQQFIAAVDAITEPL